MAEEKSMQCCEDKKQWRGGGGAGGGMYGLAFLGAAIYFIQHAGSFWMGVFGVLKALVWPAIVIYKVLGFFKM